MNKEYYLIGFKTTGEKIIDRTLRAKNVKEAEIVFKDRNDFKKLLEKYNLTIVKSLWTEGVDKTK